MASTPEFDYVIVGAGSAGCVLANRLSADGSTSVLLIEAGDWDRDPWIHIPLGWGKILQKRLHDWGYFCEPEAAVAGRAVECARGKVVGGCSSTNAMAYVRGHRSDFDRWAQASGDPGWGYESLLPYFRRSERWEGGASSWRGGDGPLSVQNCRYQDPLIGAYAEAGRSAGFGWTDDYNGAEQEGFSRLQVTIGNGRRCSTATAYLRPALGRRNLKVTVRAMATRILFEGRRACGIEYQVDGQLRVARARRELLLCGGVINSPQLLMLSGVGDPQQLAALDIPVRTALPGVGRNLHDHVSVIIMYQRREPGPFHAMMRADRIGRELARAWLFGSGFASDIPGGIVAFLKSDAAREAPDTQLILTTAPLGAWPYLRPFKEPFNDGFACRLVMLRPESRGEVLLKSRNPLEHPRILQRFLSADADWRTLRAGVRMAREVSAQPSMQQFIARETVPGSGKVSEEDINAWIRNTAITVHHPAGTCRLGREDDADAVVDGSLKVRGTEALRVVDASVMPELPGGNINAAVIAIAERAADLIGQPRSASAAH